MDGLVLIIDADELERRYISALLAADGFDVTQVARPAEGMIVAASGRPSVVILASQREGADRQRSVRLKRLVRVFRRITGVPLVIIGDPETCDEVELLVSGGDFFLGRGFAASELISRIRMLLRSESKSLRQRRVLSSAPEIALARLAEAIIGGDHKFGKGWQAA
jgi:DNA-binding response OmpR family regulator